MISSAGLARSRVVIFCVASLLACMACGSSFDARPQASFDALWRAVDENYSLFDFKGVDWHEAYQRYRPQVRDGMSERELFGVMQAMLAELRDAHVSLSSPFQTFFYEAIFLEPADQFDWDLLQRFYVRDVQRAGALHYQKLDELGYLYIPTFEGGIDDEKLDAALSGLEPSTGLIIDVRENGGGSPTLAEKVAGRLASEAYIYLQERRKIGRAHDAFGGAATRLVQPGGRVRYPGPVALLVDQGCYSACNAFALALRSLPQATLIGTPTGGGGGAPVSKDLPNGWVVRMTASQLLDAMGQPIEGGLAPTVQVELKPEDRAAGIDTILERAMVLLRGIASTGL